MKTVNSAVKQTLPKVFINTELIPAVDKGKNCVKRCQTMASNPQQTTKAHLQFLYPLSKQHFSNLKEYGPLEQKRKCFM